MSRFVLDCAISRPPQARTADWVAAATTRAWAPPTGGYHEARTAHALLVESQRALSELVGGANAWFSAEPATAVAHAALDAAAGADLTAVAAGAADPLVLQEQSEAVAAQLGLPHRVLPVDAAGRLRPADLPSRILLLTAAANQEIGSVQTDLGAWARASGSRVVLEASCALGWVDLPAWWDRLVLDPRAWGGVAGAAVVISRRPGRPRLSDNVPAAVVAGLSGQEWAKVAGDASARVRPLLQRIRERLLAEVPDVEVHGGTGRDLPHVLSVSVLYLDAEALQTRLDARGYGVGSGSACASRSGEPSHVLAAIGGLTSGNIRLGLPPDVTQTVGDGFVDAFVQEVAALRDEMGTTSL